MPLTKLNFKKRWLLNLNMPLRFFLVRVMIEYQNNWSLSKLQQYFPIILSSTCPINDSSLGGLISLVYSENMCTTKYSHLSIDFPLSLKNGFSHLKVPA